MCPLGFGILSFECMAAPVGESVLLARTAWQVLGVVSSHGTEGHRPNKTARAGSLALDKSWGERH